MNNYTIVLLSEVSRIMT